MRYETKRENLRECGSTLYVGLARTAPPTNKNFRLTVTVPGKRDHLGKFFKIELLLQQERVGFELQYALHI